MWSKSLMPSNAPIETNLDHPMLSTAPDSSDQHPAGKNPPGAVISSAEKVRDIFAIKADVQDGVDQMISMAIEQAFALFVIELSGHESDSASGSSPECPP